MTRYAGILRDAAGLRAALERLTEIGAAVSQPNSSNGYEARNLQQVGTLVLRSALAREESRGCHHRAEYPDAAAAPARSLVVRLDADYSAQVEELAAVC